MGLYKTAEQKLNLLKKNYPNSPYLAGSIEMKFPQVDETKPKLAEELPDSIVPITKYEEENVDTVRQTRAAPQVETKSVKSQGKYTLQVGAFSTSANAEKQKLLLDSYGQPIEIKSSVRNGRTLYLVHVGSFQTPEEARSVAKDIQLKYNVQSMVVEK
jgi:cell division protein FtsN